MRLVGDTLFTGRKLADLFAEKLKEMTDAIDSISEEKILNTDSKELVDYLQESHNIDAIKLQTDRLETGTKETRLDAHRHVEGYFEGFSQPPRIFGTTLEFHVPFSGDGELLQYRPSTYKMGGPTAVVKDGELTISVEFGEKEANHDEIDRMCERELSKIEEYLEWQRKDIAQFREKLVSTANTLLDSRKKRLLVGQEILIKINKPIRRLDAPRTYHIPKVRKKIEFPKQRHGSKSRVEELALATEVYEDILDILESMVAVMELSPRAFSDLDEEALRFHFLVPLNVQYKGDATAETFNYTGKTDIIIRAEGKSLFVAECKVWDGPKTLTDTIDQILGYLTWRDTKAAILLFNRNKGFSKVLEKIPGTVKEHPCCDRQLEYNSDRGCRFEMHRPDDSQGKLLLTVLAFDIPRLDELPPMD